MFGQLFFVFVGLFLIFSGIDQGQLWDIGIGIACVVIAFERLFHLKSGKENFGIGKSSQ